MKKNLLELLVVASVVILAGCGSGDGDNSTNNDKTDSLRMTVFKKTLQTKSYDEAGNEVTNGSIKDDGYYQRGLKPSYDRDTISEVVTDSNTNLMWHDTADILDNRQLFDEAKTYCENNFLSGWRLPTIAELSTLQQYNYRIVNNNYIHDNLVFKFYDIFGYWSNSDALYIDDEYDDAWYIGIGSHSQSSPKYFAKSVRCVKGDLPSDLGFERYESGIVYDKSTQLSWQDYYSDNGGVVEEATWIDAITYCENLTLGGFNDWRLPNINALNTIVDYSKAAPAISDNFMYTAIESKDPGTPRNYWSSTTETLPSVGAKFQYAMIAWFQGGIINRTHKNYDSNVVRCVRGGNYEDPTSY